LAVGTDARYDDALALLRKEFADLDELQYRARRVVERMALVLQGSLLVRHGNPAVTDAFLASRLSGDWGVAFGTLPTGLDTATILDRAAVAE
jgi:putative acyl-CoA dehydrogenase